MEKTFVAGIRLTVVAESIEDAEKRINSIFEFYEDGLEGIMSARIKYLFDASPTKKGD